MRKNVWIIQKLLIKHAKNCDKHQIMQMENYTILHPPNLNVHVAEEM